MKRPLQLTKDEVAKLTVNPIFAGVGPYPAVISDAEWIAAVGRMISEQGAERVLTALLASLRDAFPPLPQPEN